AAGSSSTNPDARRSRITWRPMAASSSGDSVRDAELPMVGRSAGHAGAAANAAASTKSTNRVIPPIIRHRPRCYTRAMELVKEWYRRYLSNPQVLILALLLAAGFLAVLWF